MTIPRAVLGLLLAGCLGAGSTVARAQDPAESARKSRVVLRKYCVECHGGKEVKGELKVLDPKALINKGLVKPETPDASELLEMVDCGSMPPGTREKVTKEDRKVLRDWVVAGAPPFPAEGGDSYVLDMIAGDLRTLSADPARMSRQRYVSFNHLRDLPDAALYLDVCRDAFLKALNHLTTMPELVRPTPIDPDRTIYRLDLQDLGWDARFFENAKKRSDLNLYDVLLLEYPYAPLPNLTERSGDVLANYLTNSGLRSPVLFVRGDWLIMSATQPPLYEVLLGLKRWFKDWKSNQEKGQASLIEIDKNPEWAGFPDPKGGPNSYRLISHSGAREGYFWRMTDRLKGEPGDLVKLADQPQALPGLMLFSLPNGLQAYYIANGRGQRLAEAPRETVTDPQSPTGVATNGLSCIRCHDRGVKEFTDTFHDAIGRAFLPGPEMQRLERRFPGQDAMRRHLDAGRLRYRAILDKLLGPKPEDYEPLSLVTSRSLKQAGREEILSGRVLPLDGLTQPDSCPREFPVNAVTLAVRNIKTDQETTQFKIGEELSVEVTNQTDKEIYFELIEVDWDGRQLVMEPKRTLAPKGRYRYPADLKVNPKPSATVQGPVGKDRFVLFASDVPFPPGDLLEYKGVADRVVHPFYTLSPEGKKVLLNFDPARLIKKTLQFETIAGEQPRK